MVIDGKPALPNSSSSTPPTPELTDTVVHYQKFIPNDDIEAQFEVTERNSESTSVLPADPFHFRNALKSSAELDAIRRRRKGRRLAKYHARQNNLIGSLLKSIEEHTSEARVEEEAARLPVKIAVWASLIANFSLCVLQMYAAISALSLSLLATGIDSIFDIGSNLLLFWLHTKAEKLNEEKWPVGGARLETIGNVVYGSLMGSVNLVVIVESARSLITHYRDADDVLNNFHLPSIIAVASALFVKLLLFLYCYSLRKNSSQVRVLWEDHRNDLWINTFGILMSTGGSKLRWCMYSIRLLRAFFPLPITAPNSKDTCELSVRSFNLDPMGAIIIALGVIVAWGRTIYGEFELLAGKAAPHDMLQLLIYKSMTYSEEIEKIDTVRAYHSGPDYFVEIDIVMDAKTPLWKAHDLSQKLQDQIEELPNVERAFVHVDYETTHMPEHRKRLQ
ncbi:hypothetical protein D9758_002441 [Tetrapyrgos nigripes]|uniref:Cation efflux protein cytoplasmic domain-containing protein n=1 Tax=Tetrapyrgos nigripes TaxID=182062 RepID=A0A8H5GNJ6_9AGAR|nr:hypothetical protein D9758_002441 [Tetrapyrgos nigripes]